MKTWHIAALVIVGLIVAGIAYTMYEKKRGRIPLGGVFDVGGSAVLNNHQRPKDDPTKVPGLKPQEPERPAGPGYGLDPVGRRIYGPTRKTFERATRDRDDGEFWNWL
jgi:hypothetical protein